MPFPSPFLFVPEQNLFVHNLILYDCKKNNKKKMKKNYLTDDDNYK
jgi:hypothetical protein